MTISSIIWQSVKITIKGVTEDYGNCLVDFRPSKEVTGISNSTGYSIYIQKIDRDRTTGESCFAGDATITHLVSNGFKAVGSQYRGKKKYPVIIEGRF